MYLLGFVKSIFLVDRDSDEFIVYTEMCRIYLERLLCLSLQSPSVYRIPR